jgi:hypothetical protein
MTAVPVGVAALDWISGADPLSVGVRTALRTETLGYALDGEYVETFWLPILGPSSILALRRLRRWLTASPDGITVPLATLSACLGLGHGTGRHASIVRTLGRLVDFHLATIEADRYLIVPTVPLLSPRLLRRLPPGLLTAHEQLIQGSTREVGQASPAPLFTPGRTHPDTDAATPRSVRRAR